MNTVYCTGTNIMSPLGWTTDHNFEQVFAGKTGLTFRDYAFLDGPHPVATFDEEVLNHYLTQSLGANWSGYSPLEALCISSVKDAIRNQTEEIDPARTLLILCTTKGNIDKLAEAGSDDQASNLFASARRINDYFGFQSKPLVVSNACISGLEGIIVGQRLVKAGRFRHVIVTGGDRTTKFVLSGFKSFNALSKSLCQPFDQERQGINLGEGVATVILSTRPSAGGIAVSDGAVSNDATHISAPSRTGDGLFAAVQRVLQRSRRSVDVVCAHGTATRYNDDMESVAFNRAQLAHKPVLSLKSYFGHTLGAAGLLEAVISVEMIRRGRVPASRGYQTSGTVQPLNIVTQAYARPVTSVLKTVSGFGGCNAAVLFTQS